MTQEQDLPKSLPDQIYAEFFARLEADPAKDNHLVQALRSCLSSGAIGDRKLILSSVADALNEAVAE